MLVLFVCVILLIVSVILIKKKRKRLDNSMTDRHVTDGVLQDAEASSDLFDIKAEAGDPIRFLFMKLYPAGKCVVCTSGDPRFKMLVQNALWEARNIRVDIDLDKFRERMQTLAVPEAVIEDYLSNIRLLDETSLQVENA